jgi:hypothetical protein
MKEIVKAACLEKIESDSAKRAKLAKILEQNIINLGVWTKNWLNLPKRPTPAQRKAALKKVGKAAHSLTEQLKMLDGDSNDDFRRAILSDPFSSRALGFDLKFAATHPSRGYAEFRVLIDIIIKLEQWAAIAQEITQEPKDGDKLADIKRWYAEGLIQIWIMIGHKRPTITWRWDRSKTTGALMKFANAAARPFGFEPMEAALRQEIEQWRKTGPKPPSKTPLRPVD